MMNEYVNEKRVYDHRGKDMIAINYIHLLESIAGRDVAGSRINKEIEGNLIAAFEQGIKGLDSGDEISVIKPEALAELPEDFMTREMVIPNRAKCAAVIDEFFDIEVLNTFEVVAVSPHRAENAGREWIKWVDLDHLKAWLPRDVDPDKDMLP